MNILFIFTREKPQSKAKPLVDLEAIQFGISFISAFLKQHGHHTDLLIMTRESDFSVLDHKISQFRPHVIGFTAVATEYPFVERIGRYIKARFTTPFLVLGGSHASLAPDEGMLVTFDALCIGEGEYPSLELVQQLSQGKQPSGIPNLWIRTETGIEKNPPRPFINDLDSLPFPDREMWYPWIDFPISSQRPSLLLGRGCPYDCTYCCNHSLSKLASGQYVRVRSPQNIIGEIEQILSVLPEIKEIYFEVETFCAKMEWSLDLCSELQRFNARRSRPLAFGVNIRISPHFARQDMDRYFLRLKQAGFRSVNIGLESGSDQLRTNILHRKYSNEDILSAVAAAKRQGMEVVFFNLIGLPTETLEDFHQTVDINYHAQPHWHYLSIFFPYPGTKLHEICSQIVQLPENLLEQGMERVRATIDLPSFSRAQIQKAFIWFDYYVYRDTLPLLFLADLLLQKYRQVYPQDDDFALAKVIANDILDPHLQFDQAYRPQILFRLLMMRLSSLSEAVAAHPQAYRLSPWRPLHSEPVTLVDCELNLRELHCLAESEHGYFFPVLTCRTQQGEEFTARMKLHITEPLAELHFLDPRPFNDEGVQVNSWESPYFARRCSYADDSHSQLTLTAEPPAEIRSFYVRLEQITEVYQHKLDSLQQRGSLPVTPLSMAFTCHDPSVVGGGNIILFRFINWLADLGIRVTIYSCGRPPAWTRVQARFVFFEHYAGMFSSISEDIIVIFTMWHIEPLLRANLRGKRVIHLRQIFEPHHYGEDFESYMARKPVIELLEGLPLGVITISPHLEEWYRVRLGRESQLITNGIDRRVFRPAERQRQSTGPCHVVSVGNPKAGVKGVGILAAALAGLVRKRPDLQISWTIASHDSEDQEFCSGMRKAGVNVRQVTIDSHDEMAHLYHSADVCVNPSLYEGFGLPSLEAMACGTPVVQADNKGLDHIARHGQNCLIVPINDPLAMAQAIECLLDNPVLTERLKKGGEETADAYSLSVQYENFLACFTTILERDFDQEVVCRTKRNLSRQSQPLVSVVIPSYNQAEFLPETLDSIRAQSYQNWEAVVINDGSTDNTEAVMSAYAAIDHRIRVFSKPNGGISSALNEGIRQARGDLFCWLSSDDLFYPQKLESQVQAFERLGPDYALVYGSVDLLKEQTKTIEEQPFCTPLVEGAEFPEGLKFDFVDGCSIMIRMSALREIKGFNPYYRHSQDFELWVRLASRGYRFYLLNEKVTIRRVHEAQSSTVNSIHCRYDAAWMMNFYLAHFNLLEVYHYFDLYSESRRNQFVEHLVGRMLHTEANVNNPLLQKKFWNWIDLGLCPLPAEDQVQILFLVLKQILKHRSVTYKMEFYLSACLDALLNERSQSPCRLDFTVAARDIRDNDRQDDLFAQELFDYGCDLLVNENTPRIVKDFELHDMHKYVDTPYKLGHSIVRYLHQFKNLLSERVSDYSAMSFIPRTDDEAFQLFCHLRYPRMADTLISHAKAVEQAARLEVEALEQAISNFPQEIFADLAAVCSRNPTRKILYYWLAIGLSSAGDVKGAACNGMAALCLAEKYHDPRLALRIALWNEQAGQYSHALQASIMALSQRLYHYETKEMLSRLLVHSRSTIPKVCGEISDTTIETLNSLSCLNFWPALDGSMGLDLVTSNGINGSVTIPLELSLKCLQIDNGMQTIAITAQDIFQFFRNGYDFREAEIAYLTERSTKSLPPAVAFTIKWSSVLGGGPMMVYRYAKWLTELGVAVTVYSDDEPPAWVDVECNFRKIPNDHERYAAITEPVILFYSILEAQMLLRHCDTSCKRIYHLCQAIEDFYYHDGSFESIFRSKPFFEILNSLPVGRLVVSHHLQEFYLNAYNQQSHLIENGIDPAVFAPVKCDRLTLSPVIMTCGNPNNRVKGSRDIISALSLLKQQFPNIDFKLLIVSGQQIEMPNDLKTTSLGFETILMCQVDQHKMRELYAVADVYVNSSWYEGFGLPTLEAMACGVPVVQADNRGLDGIVQNNENCLMVPPANPAALAGALKNILSDEKLASRLVLNGLQTAKKHHIANQFDMFIKEFQKILAWKFDNALVASLQEKIVKGTVEDRLTVLVSKYRSLQ